MVMVRKDECWGEVNEILCEVTKSITDKTPEYKSYVDLKYSVLKETLFNRSKPLVISEEFNSNEDLWYFVIWQYLVSEENITCMIAKSESPKEEKSINKESFLELCSVYKEENGFLKVMAPDFDKAIDILKELHWIKTGKNDGELKYLKSMQNALIELIAVPYCKDNKGDKSRGYPYKTLELVAKRIQEDKRALKEKKKGKNIEASNSKRKLILSWKDNIQDYCFEVFDGANKRLFLENKEGINIDTAEGWDNLTGSFLTNSIYRMLKILDKNYGFIKSRMDGDVLKGIYFLIEKLIDIKGMGNIEKAKFMEYMLSYLPASIENMKHNGKGKIEVADYARVFGDMANILNKFDVYGFIKICEERIKGVDIKDEQIELIRRRIYCESSDFIRGCSQSQKEGNDTVKSKNTIFFEQISRAVLYNMYYRILY
ncbi:MAG: hypothetical protein HFH70_09260 [Lachnospiraceae bacterium]|nr:hypothetical protein [Lachnospiraceae bacterium]